MIWRRIKHWLLVGNRWREIERFDPQWKQRISMMAACMDLEDRSVVDLGCGPMWLREFLPSSVSYVGVDYVDRGDGSLVCDFNRHEFPQMEPSAWFVSGCLEYVEDVDWFVGCIAAHGGKCILSYCALDEFPDMNFRRARGWVNHMDRAALCALFFRLGFVLQSESMTVSRNRIFVFLPRVRG